ncbi:MAG: restriction endonuclease subunit S [Lachnospiraceae bacterium]|nr:restriction endonuclease subunit S [Lachnospiraceae bacterium]
MIDINKAKQKILDLAIRGKLTKQHLKDGNINDEIIHYIDNVEMDNEYKKNKKQVKINIIEELPFNIPKTWSWVRLGNICSIFGRIGYRGYTKDDIVDDGNGAISLSPSNLVGFGKMDYFNCTYISWDKYNESPEIMVNNEDIIIVKTGSSYGKTGFVSNLQKRATINPQLAILKYLQGNRKYILIILNTVFVKKQLDDFVLGSAVPTFSQEDLANLMIPLPPLAEQNRIVEKVDKLFEILDKINETQKKYQKDKEILKSKIIEAGIRGKLTKQLKTDGNASDLLDEIRKEKEKLIKEGKIKRDKKETYIYKNTKDNLYYEKYQDGTEKCIQDELPFEIPDNWAWCRLENICDIINGFTPLRSNKAYWDNGDIPWFTIEDIRHQGRIITKTEQHITKEALSKDSKRIIPKDSVLLCCTASVGEFAYTKIPLTTNQQFNGLIIKRCYKCFILPLYLFSFSQTLKKQIIERAGGTTFGFLSVGELAKFFVSIPPLSEQKRIINIVEKLLAYIDD